MTQTNENIILLLSAGYTVKEIAAMLDMKFVTVRKRIYTMMRKSQARTVTQLVVKKLNPEFGQMPPTA
jgi:DNA-binding NarL/FixJ family response regulator